MLVDIKPAPAMRPSCRAAISAASSTTSPREMLTRCAVGFIADRNLRIDQVPGLRTTGHGGDHEIGGAGHILDPVELLRVELDGFGERL